MNKEKFYFWVLLDVLIAVIIIGVIFFAFPAFMASRASLPPARTITVTAEGKTTASPDLAEVSFSVVSQGASPEVLSTNNTNKMNAVLQFVAAQGISASDTATTAYDLSPNYQFDPTTQRQYATGYTLTQTVTIKVHDLTKVATIIGGLAPLGVNEIGGVTFTFNDQNAVVAPARADAMAQAKTKALSMASEAGASLGEPVSVAENTYIPMPQPVYNMESGVGAMAVPSAVSPNIQPGTQDVTDTVTITYALQ